MLISHFWAGCPVHPFNLEIYAFSLGNSFYHYFFKKHCLLCFHCSLLLQFLYLDVKLLALIFYLTFSLIFDFVF